MEATTMGYIGLGFSVQDLRVLGFLGFQGLGLGFRV